MSIFMTLSQKRTEEKRLQLLNMPKSACMCVAPEKMFTFYWVLSGSSIATQRFRNGKKNTDRIKSL